MMISCDGETEKGLAAEGKLRGAGIKQGLKYRRSPHN